MYVLFITCYSIWIWGRHTTKQLMELKWIFMVFVGHFSLFTKTANVQLTSINYCLERRNWYINNIRIMFILGIMLKHFTLVKIHHFVVILLHKSEQKWVSIRSKWGLFIIYYFPVISYQLIYYSSCFGCWNWSLFTI